MAHQKKPALDELKKKAPSIDQTKQGLNNLKEKVPKKKSTFQLLGEFLRDHKNMSSKEQKKKIGAILSALALSLIIGKKKEKSSKKAEEDVSTVSAETSREESTEADQGHEHGHEEEAESKSVGVDEARQVVCSDMRLILINTDPARGKFAAVAKAVPKGDSEHLNKFGLPNYKTWKREMISMLAPDASSEGDGVRKVTDILQWCPMGKYQCMPKYLFAHVKLPFEGEEGLKAMWKFLQTEELQRKACRGYLMNSARQFDNDSELVAASFYGGPKAAKALKAYKAEKARQLRLKSGSATEKDKKGPVATAKQIAYVEKRQGSYSSIKNYSKGSKSKSFDINALLAQTAGRESGSWKGKKSLERDEKWEEKRYNKYWQGADETMIA